MDKKEDWHKIRHKRLFTNDQFLHYAVVGKGQPIVLIHGFPQTYIQWKAMVPKLWEDFKMIVPNLRGIGGNPGPASGYDKHSLAADIKAILLEECVNEKIIICGHGIGGQVGFAYALHNREDVKNLVLVNAFPPGTDKMNKITEAQAIWRKWFPADTDLACMLIAGKERDYIRHIIQSNSYDTAAITESDLEIYAAAYRAPGAMRAALEMYRTLNADGELNLASLEEKGKLTIPVTGIASDCDKNVLQEMLDEISIDNTAVVVTNTGHWIANEQQQAIEQIIRSLTY